MKGTGHSNPNHGFLLPWAIAALFWGLSSCFLLDEYKRAGDPRYLRDIFFLLSLFWMQFGFAAIFNTIYSGRYARLKSYIAVTFLPPLLVYLLMVV